MDIARAQQIALDDALVAHANRLTIGKTDVSEIYMQEFWATSTVHHHSIRFKMNNKKHIVNLEDIGHSEEIKVITNVNVNKLRQPWRSFVEGMYYKKNVDYTYLLWEDFVYQVENKNVKRSNEMYYPRFTKVALIEAEQMKLDTKRSLIQTHSSYASDSGADEGTGGKPGVPDVPTYGSDDEKISWKSSDEENDDEVGMSDDDDDNDDDMMT
ncbi:hypothetical protein Tco_1579036, partial [Tanacetum coccineum]